MYILGTEHDFSKKKNILPVPEKTKIICESKKKKLMLQW